MQQYPAFDPAVFVLVAKVLQELHEDLVLGLLATLDFGMQLGVVDAPTSGMVRTSGPRLL